MQRKLGSKGQHWSTEMLIAIAVFILVFIIIIATMTIKEKPQAKEVVQTSELFINKFYGQSDDARTIAFIENNVVNKDKLERLKEMDYESLKAELGLEDDFCIIVVSSNGTLLPIDGAYGIGSSSILIDGQYACNDTVS
ncbi:MAG TPA: hypothetical protein VK158_00395 [Acidobacteriota bacterium]|nr:hypothetical protein [Acidobacteriota bacterium]